MTAEAHALCDQVRAAIVGVGWSEAARRSGVDRCNLHRAFPAKRKPGHLPNFATIAAVTEAIGLQLTLARPEPPPPGARDLTHCPDGDGGYS